MTCLISYYRGSITTSKVYCTVSSQQTTIMWNARARWEVKHS